MTPADFQRYGIRMYGRKHWRREYSINLGLDASTVWRMSTRTTDLPLVVEVAVRGLLQKHRILEDARKGERDRKRVKNALRKHRKKEKANEQPLETAAEPAASEGGV